jgi:phosphinothricin acetyltransferase
MQQPVHPVAIEPSREEDVEDIQSIYAHYVGSSLATFEVEPPTAIQMLSRRADVLRGGYPHLVARRDGRVIGYAYANAYRARPAYRFTVENSIYVDHRVHRSGAGRALLQALVDQCRDQGFQQMVAVIGDSANTASIGLHAALGFEHAGVLRRVGHKFGRWVDTVLMQRSLAP